MKKMVDLTVDELQARIDDVRAKLNEARARHGRTDRLQRELSQLLHLQIAKHHVKPSRRRLIRFARAVGAHP